MSSMVAADPAGAAPIDPPVSTASGQFPFARWILRRIAWALVVLFVVSVLVFLATIALPSDAARAILGRQATPERLELLRDQLNLNDSLWTQYTSWIGGIVQGDFGNSLASRAPVTDTIGPRLVNSAILVALTALVAVPLSFVLGTLSAARRDGLFDHTLTFTALIVTALPEFVVGLVLVILLSTTIFNLFPAVALIPPGDTPLEHLDRLILPVFTLTLVIFPYLYRLVRGSVIDALNSEYVRTARLKGLASRTILFRHTLPNAAIPAVQATALSLAYLTGGIVVVEFVFGYPGLGTALTSAIANRDVPLIQAVVLIFAAAYMIFNLLADLLTVLLTPRLRTGGR